MTQAERRHDRLAVRLSLIISRLVAGETLNMARLAAEFGVSVRTLRRDFRERLMYLDLEYRRGQCRLRSTGGGVQGELDALTFAHRASSGDYPCGDSPEHHFYPARTSQPVNHTGGLYPGSTALQLYSRNPVSWAL